MKGKLGQKDFATEFKASKGARVLFVRKRTERINNTNQNPCLKGKAAQQPIGDENCKLFAKRVLQAWIS